MDANGPVRSFVQENCSRSSSNRSSQSSSFSGFSGGGDLSGGLIRSDASLTGSGSFMAQPPLPHNIASQQSAGTGSNQTSGETADANSAAAPVKKPYRAYRSRLNRPCDYCRKRRTRCDIIEPNLCVLCSKIGKTCTFNELPTKKKRSNTPSAKGSASKKHDSGNANASNASSAIPSAHSDTTTTTGAASNKGLGLRSRPRPSLESNRTSSNDTNNDDTKPKTEAQTEPSSGAYPPLLPQGMDGLALLGLSGDQDPNLVQYYNYNAQENIAFIKSSIRRASSDPMFPVQFLAFTDERSLGYKKQAKEQLIQIRKLASRYEERLLALYFRFVHDSYPIIDKDVFEQKYRANKDNIEPGLLAGMLALSSAWWKYDSTLCVEPIPYGFDDALFAECRIAIEREFRYPTLATIQTFLLLLQRRLSLDDTADSFASSVDMARLVAISHNLGLHLDCSNWNISARLKSLRRKLWATVYLMEKWTAVNNGRPSLLHSSGTTWELYTSDDESESLFVQLLKLTAILDDIHGELYSEKLHIEQYKNQVQTQQRVTHYFARLKEWRDQIPQDLQSMKQHRRGEYCKNGTLHLAALTVEVILQKVRLSPASFSVPEYRYYRQQVAELIQRIIVFTSEITHSHLTAFWYCSARLSFSTIAHFVYYYHITSLTTNEHRDTKELIRKWLWALRTLSQAWEEGTGLATSKLDSIFWTGDNLFSELVPRPSNKNSVLKAKTTVEMTKNDLYASRNGPKNMPRNVSRNVPKDIPNDMHRGISSEVSRDTTPHEELQNLAHAPLLSSSYHANSGMNEMQLLPGWSTSADVRSVPANMASFSQQQTHTNAATDHGHPELHTDWMTNDIALLHEDIMPQEEQFQQLINTLDVSSSTLSFENPLPDRYFSFDSLVAPHGNQVSQVPQASDDSMMQTQKSLYKQTEFHPYAPADHSLNFHFEKPDN